jgi:hypothetical protein
MDIEKNDVNLSSLFKWQTKITIKDANGNDAAYAFMRLVGDADLNRARVFALRESSKLRKALKTPGTDEYEGYIAQIKEQEKDILTRAILLFEINELSESARKDVDLKFPIEPKSDASQEEHEEYQKELDDFPKNFADASEKILRKRIKQEEKRLEAMEEQDLKKEYIAGFINYLCQEEMTRKFIDFCVYLGTFKDKRYKNKAFENFEDFNNSAPELKEQLKKEYNELEMKIPDLKKLPEATQSQPLGALPKDNG